MISFYFTDQFNRQQDGGAGADDGELYFSVFILWLYIDVRIIFKSHNVKSMVTDHDAQFIFICLYYVYRYLYENCYKLPWFHFISQTNSIISKMAVEKNVSYYTI
jgi:hypothetical protein